MSQLIINKIRAGRQTSVPVGKFTFTVRRPTEMELLEIQQRRNEGNSITQGEILNRFVVGWEGVTELDVFPGGTGLAVEFSAELFAEWIVDQSQLWLPLTTAVIEAYRLHDSAMAAELKNSTPG